MLKGYSPLKPHTSPPRGKDLFTSIPLPFYTKQSSLIYLIMDYFRSENFTKTLIALEQETSLSLFSYNQELTFLRKLIIDGQWKEAEEFLTPLKQNTNFNYKHALYELRKQKFLEEVENEPENNNEVDNLVKQLKDLQTLTEPEEFSQLLSNLSTSPNPNEWNVSSGRLKCFQKIRTLLNIVYPIQPQEVKTFDCIIHKLLQRILIYVNNRIKNINNYVDLYGMLQYFVNDDNNENNVNLYIENDIKRYGGNNYISNNNSSINSRNEFIISQSIQRDKEVKDNNITNNTITEKNDSENIVTTRRDNSSLLLDTNIINNNNNNTNNINKENNISNNIINVTNDNNNTNIKDDSFIIENYYNKYETYNINSFTLKHSLSYSTIIRTSCYSPKGDYLAIGTNAKSIKIFNLQSIIDSFEHNTYYQSHITYDTPLLFEQKSHHLGSIYCLDWSVSGRLLASGSNDKVIKLMVVPDLDGEGVSSQDENDVLELSITGHRGIIRSIVFDPLSDLVLFSAGMVDNVIKVWDTENGELKGELKGHLSDINTLKWSNEGTYFASGSSDKMIKLWDLRTMKQNGTINASKYDIINDISIYCKGRNNALIASGHCDGKLTIWDLYSKRLIKEIKCCIQGQEIRAVEFSPDGKYLLVGGFDSVLRIYDTTNNAFTLVKELQHNDKVISAKWHQHMPLITSTSSDKSIRMWLPGQQIQ